MSTRINTNTTAEMAAFNLSMNSDKLSGNIQRLSSGLRINSAADDAAGLVISTNMKAQSTGLAQATRNSNDAINMVKTAEGALNEVHGLLMSIRQLAVHASNLGVNSSADLAADQTQISSAIQSLNRIAGTTSFGTKKLLDGSANSGMTTTSGSATLSQGSSVTMLAQGAYTSANAYNYTAMTVGQATAASFSEALTAGTNAPALTSGASTNAVFAGSLTIGSTTYNVGTASGQTVNLSGLNQAIASSGYQASVASGNLVFTSQATGQAASTANFNTNSLVVGTPATGGASLAAGSYTAGGAAAKAVETFQATGYTAAATAASTYMNNAGNLTLFDQGAATATSKVISYSAGESISALSAAVSTATSGYTNGAINTTVNASGQVQFQSNANGADGAGAQSHMAVFNPTDGSTGNPSIYSAATQATGTFTNGVNASLTLSDGNGHTMKSNSTQQVGTTNYFAFSNGLQLSGATTLTTATATGTLNATAGTTTKGQDLQFQVGANGGQTASIGVQSVAADQLGTGSAAYTDANGTSQTVNTDSVKDINVTSFKGAQDALAVIDNAISQISTVRANLGAFQSNVLQSNVRSLGVAQQNLQASESTIKDTDLSSEIVDYTKNQILVQAGTSALSQANQQPQAILKLLG